MKFHLIILCISSISQLTDLASTGVLECSQNEDCVAEEATCSSELCVCPLGKTFSYDGSQCLQIGVGYESACEEDVQCAWLMGKHICNTNNKCVCADGWRYHRGKCLEAKKFSARCTENEECFVSHDIYAMVCTDGICACNEGYYLRGDYDCRMEGREVGDACALDMDCKFDNSYCDRSQCEIRSTRRNISESSHAQEKYLSRDVYVIGASCVNNEDCEDVNSFCSPLTKQCVCQRGYFLQSSRCIGELGVNVGCTADSDCTIPPRSYCVDGACVCPLTRYYSPGLDRCIKVSFSPDFECVDDNWCSIMGPNAICAGDDETYCRCPLNMELDENFICQPAAPGSNNGTQCEEETRCVLPSDCTEVVNWICQNGICVCPDNHRLEDNVCLPNIGAACSENSECQLEHTYCEASVCRCEANYVAGGPLECVSVAAGLGFPCDVDIQCSTAVDNSNCMDGICACDIGHVDRDEECLEAKSIGDYCVNAAQCRVLLGNNVLCRNSLCQCSADMEVTPDGVDCRYAGAAPKRYCASLSFLITLVLFYVA